LNLSEELPFFLLSQKLSFIRLPLVGNLLDELGHLLFGVFLQLVLFLNDLLNFFFWHSKQKSHIIDLVFNVEHFVFLLSFGGFFIILELLDDLEFLFIVRVVICSLGWGFKIR
jgi:hypothetical protein